MRKLHRWAGLLLALLVFLLAGCAQANPQQKTDINLLSNSMAAELDDTGMPADWFTEAWTTDSWVTQFSVSDGVFCVESVRNNDARFAQTVQVDPNSLYCLSGQIRVSGAEEGAGANLSFFDTFVNTPPLLDTHGAWEDVQVYGKTGDKQKECTIFVRLGGYGAESSGVAEFRNLSFVKVEDLPEGVQAQSIAPVLTGSQSTQEDTSKVKLLSVMVLLTLAYVAFLFCAGDVWAAAPQLYPKGGLQLRWCWTAAAALLVRIVIAMTVQGYPNDIACWVGWADQLAQNNPWNFYSMSGFADYPPGYMLVLWPIGWIRRLLHLTAMDPFSLLLVKLPSIVSDLLIGGGLLRLGKQEGWGDRASLLAAAAWMAHPAVLLDSAAWGQIDSLFTLVALAYLWMLYKRRIPAASLLLTVGVLVKPQMLLFAPVLLAVWILRIREAGLRSALKDVLVSLGLGMAVLVVIAGPFTPGQPWDWIIHKYIGTIGSYPYGSVNAANLISLMGGLWQNDMMTFGGVTYKVWGWVGISLSLVAFYLMVFLEKKKETGNLFLYTAAMLTGIYTFGVNMHERYMFPVIALLFVSFLVTKKRGNLWLLVSTSVVQIMTIGLVLANQYLPMEGVVLDGLSILSVVNGMAMLLYAGFTATGRGDVWDFPRKFLKRLTNLVQVQEEPANDADACEPAHIGMEKKDWLWAGLITALYVVAALVYLGSAEAPQTFWMNQQPGESVVLDLGDSHAPVSQMMVYRGLASDYAQMILEVSQDGTAYSQLQSILLDENDGGGDVFKWHTYDTYMEARYVRLTMTDPAMQLGEVVFRDAQQQVVPVLQIYGDTLGRDAGPALAFDEQGTVPSYPSFYNGTYFDEIYHARTAWEHTQGMTNVYEWTHPPLGKLIISLGIRLFGMTPFGWRIMGTLFGILMLPLMYLLGKAIFRKSRYAVIATLLMAFDFMHFTQTRIATIDVYAVFWIMGMYYCMLRYVLLDHHRTPLLRQLMWLGLSGLFFGLGAATKWTCLYAGAGLAVIFFWTVVRRMCGDAAHNQTLSSAMARDAQQSNVRYWCILCLWCILVFVLIPIVIYAASFFPYMPDGRYDFQVFMDNQMRMFNYHSQLVDDHFFKSPWYQWPIIWKPMWYYKNGGLPEGWMGSIAAFGNPAVWWMGTAAMVCLLLRLLRKGSHNKVTFFILLGYLAQFLPWVLVPRSTFIYHYFTATPFFILAVVVMISQWEKKPAGKKATWIYLGIVAALFALFYPVLSGMPISSVFGKLLRWMPTWYFTY